MVYRILTVSNGCVAVTAPHAAIPPAMKALDISFSFCLHLCKISRLTLQS
jgi:hypothetical protein